MAESVKVKLDIDAKDSIKTLDTLETQLGDLKKEIKGVEVGSKEFKKLSNEIRKTESEVKNLNKSFEGLDTEQLTGEFGKLGGGVTAAFTGIAVLGSGANKSMEAMIQTVAKGMAIMQGFKGATEALTAAQRIYNQVLKANPIGLIITAVTTFIGVIVALIAKGDQIIDMLDGWAEKFTFLQGPIDVIKKGIEGLMKLWESVKRLILGDEAVDKAIAEKAEKVRLREEIANNEWETKRLEAIKATEQEIYDVKKKGLEDRLKLLEIAGEQETDEYKDTQIELLALETEHTTHLKDEEQKRIDEWKKKQEEKLQAKKEYDQMLLDQEAGFQEQLRKFIKENSAEDELADEFDPSSDPSIQAAEAAMKKRQEIINKEADYIKSVNENTLSFKQEQINNELLMLNSFYELGLIEKEAYEQRKKELEDEYNQISIDNTKLTESDKIAIAQQSLQSMSQIISALSQLQQAQMEQELKANEGNEKKQEEIRKKYAERKKRMAIMQIIMDTAQAIIATWAGYASMSIAGTILAGIQTAAIAALSAIQIATIQKQSFSKGGMLFGPSHASGGIPIEAEGGEAVINKTSMANASLRNVASAVNVAGGGKDFSTGDGSIKLSDESIAKLAMNINNKKVYVSETDITEVQDRVSVIEEGATL